jgi:hypothetical protein
MNNKDLGNLRRKKQKLWKLKQNKTKTGD